MGLKCVRRLRVTRPFAAVITMTVASASHADFFLIGTEGSFEVTDRNADVIDATIETVVGTQFGGFNFQDVSGTFTADLIDGGEISGTLDLNGVGVDDVVSIDFSGSIDNGDRFFSYSGSWTVADASGIYDGLTGNGGLSGSSFFQQDDGGFSTLDVLGDLVPAPATLILLAGASLSFVRRRR